MSPRSDRPRSLRELRPDLFIASRRHRARDAARRAGGALARFLSHLLRRQGEDWRATCDDLRKQLAAAKREAEDSAREVRTLRRAVQVADAAARHADGERDDAQRISARWEIEAADLRDRLVEEQKRAASERRRADAMVLGAEAEQKRAAEALALLDSERAAWREERASMLREKQALVGRGLEMEARVALLGRLIEEHAARLAGSTWRDQRRVALVPPPPPAAPEVSRVPDMSRRPAAGQGTGEGGSANAFTASVAEGDDE